MDIKCFKANLPIDCSKLLLKEGDVVSFKVKAVNNLGKPAHVKYGITGSPMESVAQFTQAVTHFDALQETMIAEFFAYDDDELGTGVQPDSIMDARKAIYIKVKKKTDPLDKTPAKISHVKVFYKGKEVDPTKLLLSEGDVIHYLVEAKTSNGRQAKVQLDITGDAELSPKTYTKTVSHFDALNEFLIAPFYATDDDNVGSGVQPESAMDDLRTIFINVKKKIGKTDKDPAKITSIEMNVIKPKKLSGETKTKKESLSENQLKELKMGNGSGEKTQSTTHQ
jgi:hypothetical protein